MAKSFHWWWSMQGQQGHLDRVALQTGLSPPTSYQCVALLLVTAGGILAGEPSFSSDQSPHEMMVNTLRNDGDITSFMAD